MSQEFIHGSIEPLGQAVTDSSAFLLVTDPSGFPETFPFRILVDTEQMDVTVILPPIGGSFHQLFVNRGVNGTTAAAHAVDADVIELIPNCPAADDLSLTASVTGNKSSSASSVDTLSLTVSSTGCVLGTTVPPIAETQSLDMIWLPRFSTNITGGTFTLVFYGEDGAVIKTGAINATGRAATAQNVIDTAFVGYSGYTAGDIRIVDNCSGVTAENTLIYNSDHWYLVFDGPSVTETFWHIEPCVGDLTVSSGSANITMFVLQAAAPGAGQYMRIRKTTPSFSGAWDGDSFEIEITVDGNTVEVPPRTFSSGQSWSLLQADINSAATGAIPGYSDGDIRVLGRDDLIDTTSRLEDGGLVLMFQGASVYNKAANVIVTDSVPGVTSFSSTDSSVSVASFGPEKKVAITAPNIFHFDASYRFDITVDGTTYSTTSISSINIAGAQSRIDTALATVPGYVAGDITIQVISNWDQSTRTPNLFRFTGASVQGTTSIEAVQLSGSNPSIPFRSFDLTAATEVMGENTLSWIDFATANISYAATVENTFTLSDGAATVLVAVVTADDTLALTDSTIANVSQVITADNSLSLTNTAAASVCYEVATDNSLTLTDFAIFVLNQGVGAGDSLALNDTALSNICRLENAENNVGLSDTAHGFSLIVAASVDTLALSDSASEAAVLDVFGTDVLLFGNLAIPAFSFSRNTADSLSPSDQADATLAHFATADNELTLGDTGVVENHLIVEQTLELSDFADVVNQASNLVVLSDEAIIVRDGQRSVQEELDLSHAVAYTLIREKTDEAFSPFVGSSTQQDVPDPIDVTEPLLTPGNVQLAYPVNSPTTTLELRAPVFGNRDRLSAQRINRLTRGGELKIYADPQWPNNHTLVMEFTALTDQQVEAYLQFVATTLGKEIKLTDHEGRDWRGIITEPDEPVVRNSRKNNSASLVFEGELV